MKTKLLKKVRKRFNIVRYDKVTRKSSDWIREIDEKWGTPFFVLSDEENEFFGGAYKTYDEAYDKLKRKILAVYIYTSKKRNQETTKVWHVS